MKTGRRTKASGKPFEERVFDACLNFKCVFDFLMRMTGPLFVLAATVLISMVIAFHFKFIIPYYTPYFSFMGVFHSSISIFLAFNVAFNYYMTVFTPPGYSPDAVLDELFSRSRTLKILAWNGNSAKHVKISSYSPLRSKKKTPACTPLSHMQTVSLDCDLIQRCVLKMDHHCRIL